MSASRILISATWLIDGTGAEVLRDHTIVVASGLIAEVGPSARIEAGNQDKVVSLPGCTLCPGLINHHVHLVLPGDGTPLVPWIDGQSDAALAVRVASNAESALRAGVTTIRDCGGRGTVVLDVRDALRAMGKLGARIVACGHPLTITGGHTRQFGGEVDGQTACRKRVRKLVAAGADFIKVMVSGGGTPGSLPQYPSFSLPELRTIVEEAHSLGRRVAMHCVACAAIANAAAVKADCIEHASFVEPSGDSRFDPKLAEALAAAGTPVTPTLQVTRDVVETLPDGPERAVWQHRHDTQRQMTIELVKTGVPILAGSDSGWRSTRFDTFWKEIEALSSCGLSNRAAVHAATGAASRALGDHERYGTLRAGLEADLIAVDGDVDSDIASLGRLVGVMKSGSWVREPPIHAAST